MSKKLTPESIEDRLKSTFALYANVATSCVEKFINIQRTTDKQDPIKHFITHKFSPQEKETKWSLMKQNIVFLELLERDSWLLLPHNEASRSVEMINYFEEARKLLSLLNEIRNKWSHYQHQEPGIENGSTREIILALYNRATMNSSVKLLDKYSGEKALFFKESPKGTHDDTISKGKTIREDTSNHLTLTGYIFVISLFLPKNEINDFLNGLEQNLFSFEEQSQRQLFKEQYPGIQYPEHLRSKVKPFLYARDVYTRFAIPGHRDTLTTNEEFRYKEQAFALMEYLKRCPPQRLITRIAKGKQDQWGSSLEPDFKKVEKESADIFLMPHQMVEINDVQYQLREKNKFFEWAVTYLDEEWKTLELYSSSKYKWQWARHAPASMIKKDKKKLTPKEMLMRQPNHKKMIWEVPQQNQHLINARNEENGFPFYIERDREGNYTHVVFKLTYNKSLAITGRIGQDLLCTLMEQYFYRFPLHEIEKRKTGSCKKKRICFFENIFRGIYQLVIEACDKGKGGQMKSTITEASIRQRISFLRSREEQLKQTIDEIDQQNRDNCYKPQHNHARISYIAKTWNKMLTYGQSNNPAHATDYNGTIGGKNGYREITTYLSQMESNDHQQPGLARTALIKTLKKLRRDKDDCYFTIINRQLKASGIMGRSGSPSPLISKKIKTLNDYYRLAYKYRLAMLDQFEAQLNAPFDPAQWLPNQQMRWLGLKDNRTHEAAQNKQAAPGKHNTNIYNVDKHYYTPVGIPYLIELYHRTTPTPKGRPHQLCSCHKEIYPSPNNNTLLIETFYTISGWNQLARTDRNRLFAIKRQDTIIAHLAYHYSQLAEGTPFSNRTLRSGEFQKDHITIPIEWKEKSTTPPTPQKAQIIMFYRHFKQNRYRLLPRQIYKILSILINHQLINNNTLHFNALVKKNKADLTDEEKWNYLSNNDRKKRNYEKNQLAEENLKQIKEEEVLVPVLRKERDPFYLSEQYTAYLLCRKAFMDKIFKLEGVVISNFIVEEDEKGYIPFNQILTTLGTNCLINEEEKAILNTLRNDALHNDVPSGKYLPSADKLVKKITKSKQHPHGHTYIDFFGRGIALIHVLLENRLKQLTEE